ncbi:MAG: transcription initiation factor IIB [Promethearchaeota archaeon]
MEETKSKIKKNILGDDIIDIYHCPECGSDLVIFDAQRGENICANCGLVLDHHIPDIERADRRAFTTEEKAKRERTGSPISVLLPDLGLSTIIDPKAKMSQRMRRVIKWNSRMTWNKRNLLIATTEIKRIGTNLNLPMRVKELAAKVYRKAFNLKLLRGRSIKAMVAACIYYACRKEKVPRTLQELVEQTTSDPREIRRCYRILIKELKLRVPIMEPEMLIPKYITELGLSLEVEKLASNYLKKFQKRISISGKDPKGLVAAALYLAAQQLNQSQSQSKIAHTVGVTEVTLRSRYKEFLKILNSNTEEIESND